MSEKRVRKLLRETPAPGELDAQRRSWAVVRAAYEASERIERRRPLRPFVLVALGATLALVAAAASPTAVGSWLREAIGIERVKGEENARPALVSLPAAGRLLVGSATGPWIVRADGSRRRLGAYRDATWSPNGLFVAATRGRQLVALDPTGKARWSLSRPQPVAAPRWSPSGFRIAYGSGSALRVVAGDGSPDALVVRGVSPGAWAWRPGNEHVLAYATAQGSVYVERTDAGGRSRRLVARLERPPLELRWSAAGERLVALTEDGLVMTNGRRVLAARPLPGGARPVTAAFAPAGRALAVVGRLPAGGSEVSLFAAGLRQAGVRRLLAGPGAFGELAWSPDGRWLLVTWPSADQWVFLGAPGLRKIVAVSNIGREFDPGRPGTGRFPRVLGWCCPRSFR